MKEFIRGTAVNALSMFVISLIFSGLHVSGGLTSYLIAGALLAIFSFVLDPIVKIVTIPFTILTLGLLSFLTTLAALFVLTLVYSPVKVSDFVIEGGSFLGIEISRISVSGFLSFVVISATIYFLNKLLLWVFDR